MHDPLSRSSRLLGPLFLCLSSDFYDADDRRPTTDNDAGHYYYYYYYFDDDDTRPSFVLATSRAEDRQSIGIASLYSSLPSSSAKWLRRIPKFDTGAWHPWGTQSAPGAPVSPSDVSSHKRSEGSAVSQTSSETSFSDSKSDIKSFDDRPTPLWDQQVDNSELPAVPASKDNSSFDRPPQQRPSPRMMHQTSSRLLRMTEDDRPFTRGLQCSEQDFKDLFSTLMVSLPLTSHRVRFTRIEHTFTTEEAITNLGSLKFSQSNRMPDPKDPSRIVTTTTTTTFSMAKEMARSVCMRFLEARFVESVEGKTDFNSRGSVWQLTPKGMHILSRFCQRNGIHQKHVNELLDSPRNMMQLVILERETETDKLVHDEATVQVLFRRFAGDTGPNLKVHSSGSDSDSMSDYATGLIGVRMQRSRRNDKDAPYVFTGKAAYDWLMDCCTTVDKREIFELANSFLTNELIVPAGDERQAPSGTAPRFAASKHVLYAITQKGMRIAGWVTSPNGSVHGDGTASRVVPNGVVRDSNTNRMTVIIRDPALRLLFREYLRETHCEENLAFYVEVRSFLAEYERAKRDTSSPRLDIIRETLASAYSLYNAFLAPGSPCELNIDHNLRNALAGRMTRAVGEDEQMLKSLDEVAVLFDQAQSSVFKLMASDSVPKFSREPKYARVLRERNLEGMMNSFASASIS
ncbi:Developmental regulator [Hortaea werneckii]|nr:Developmental regulator [Hortaea werneckii]KAI7320057.1 Developmental regulator [Hortaea werneckii]